MKNKKGLWLIAGLLIVLIVAVFYFRDTTDMAEVGKEQLESAEDSLNSKIDQLNIDFDMDEDFDDVEEADLAYDTL